MENKKIISFEQVITYIPEKIRWYLSLLPDEIKENTHEIRLRTKRPVSITIQGKNELLYDNIGNMVICQKEDMEKTLNAICEMSIYSYEDEIKQGYITLKGGHRVGVCGSAVVENGEIVSIKNISSLNFRISKQITGVAGDILKYIKNNDKVFSTLIVSEPCGGKTTILCDIAKTLSEDKKRVSVIDERGEIGAVFYGEPQKDLGPFCDILDAYPKGEGMMRALRSLSPEIIICDEIGSKGDIAAMEAAMNAGVPVIASAHAKNEEELFMRPQITRLLELNTIEKIIILEGSKNPGKINKVLSVGGDVNENTRNTSYSDMLY